MKQLTLKLVAFSLFTLLLSPSITPAEQVNNMLVEGILQDTKNKPGEKRQIKLDKDWYPIEDNSDIFMCDQKMTEKNLNDLTEFINYRLSLEPSAQGLFNKINILCE